MISDEKRIDYEAERLMRLCCPYGPQDVREAVREKISGFAAGGGYILSADHNLLGDIPLENILAMYEAATAYGKYTS